MSIRYLSLFSGIEAATVAWHPLGWECVAVSEIEPFPCALLATYYPDIPNLGDVTKITEEDIKKLGRIDLVVFGSPCQDLSVAGKRGGFEGARSGLFHTAMRIIEWARTNGGARFALWENVPGAFSSTKGQDFGEVVRQMGGFNERPTMPKHGWGTEGVALGEKALLEWATLDAQWFGVAQRRRRVFALADFGDWYSRPPILLESESLRGDTPPSRRAGKKATGFTASSFGQYCEGVGTVRANGGGLGGGSETLAVWPAQAASTLNASFGSKQGIENQHIDGGAPLFVPAYALAGNTVGGQPENGGNGNGYDDSGASYTLTRTDVHAVAFYENHPTDSRVTEMGEVCTTVTSRWGTGGGNVPYAQMQMQVRRLTPTECERLQGFPDSYTKINDKTADGARYKALGNSMAVPVMRWIGVKINDALAIEGLV